MPGRPSIMLGRFAGRAVEIDLVTPGSKSNPAGWQQSHSQKCAPPVAWKAAVHPGAKTGGKGAFTRVCLHFHGSGFARKPGKLFHGPRDAGRDEERVFFSEPPPEWMGRSLRLRSSAAAGIIHRTATIEKDGFANLRFAALAGVEPFTPFFPGCLRGGIRTRLQHRGGMRG